MAVVICLATGLDYRDYFDMFGLEVGAKAKSQIQGFGYPAVERAYLAIGDVDHMRGAFTSRAGQMQKITINGTTGWPL